MAAAAQQSAGVATSNGPPQSVDFVGFYLKLCCCLS